MLARRKLFTAAPCASAAAFALALMTDAHAQTNPARSIRMIVPIPPGGTTGIIARLVAQRMRATMGQAAVVENRAGAGRDIGTAAAKLAAKYGYAIG